MFFLTHNKYIWPLAATLPLVLLGGCLGSSSDDPESTDSGIHFDISSVDYAAITVDESELAAGARLLSSQCAQCHGTYGVAVAEWPDLWGSGNQIGYWMKEYQDANTYSDNVMHLHALAYTDDEVNLLKSYFAKVDYAAGGE